MADPASADLASSGAALAHALQRRQTLRKALTLVAGHAAAGVPGAECAAVAVRRRGDRWAVLAHTDTPSRELTEQQVMLGEGPVPACVRDTTDDRGGRASAGGVLLLADTRSIRHWPGFRAAAEVREVRSVLACRVRGGQGGALVVYARQPSAFDDHAARAAELYGGFASLALFHAAMVDSLRAGLLSRQGIGEATGILMERYKISSEEAFGMLVDASQRLNTKLRDIALRVVRTDRSPHEFTAADPAAGQPG